MTDDSTSGSACERARFLHERARDREAREVVNRALPGTGDLDELRALALVGVELGDPSLDARILAAIDACADGHEDARKGVRLHTLALIERMRGEAAPSRASAARARLYYARAGLHDCAAMADDLASIPRTTPRSGNGLSEREREVATSAAKGASNAAIGRALGISEKTVEKHLSSSFRKLGLTNRVELAGALDTGRSHPGGRSSGLPAPLTPFVGRDDDLEELARLASGYRLVTVIGAGGSGKTRTAIEFARRTADRDPSVWFVDLSAVYDLRGVYPAIAAATPVDARTNPRAAVNAYLAERNALIVLDNCEQLVPELAQIVRDLLESAPGLRVVATSRRRIGLLGECVLRLKPLGSEDAVELFCERARSSGLAEADIPRIERICDRIDRVPLAIELAVSRLHDLSLAELEAALTSSSEVLQTDDRSTPQRHRSIDAMIEQSYAAIDEASRVLFRRSAVFNAPFAAERTAEMFGAGTLASLATLHRSSLLERQDDGRYRMLQVVRDVALALLRDEGAERATFATFAARYRHILEAAHESWFATPIEAWLEPLRDETAHIANAMAWCFSPGGDETTGVSLVAMAARLWGELGRESEIEDLLVAALAHEARAPERDRVRLWLARARFFDITGESAQALAASERAVSLCSERTDAREAATATLAVGCSKAALGDPSASVELERALAATRALHMKRSEATALTALAIIATDPGVAVSMFLQQLEVARSLENRLLEAITLANLGEAYGLCGDDERSLAHLREAAELFERLGAQVRRARCLATLAKREEALGERAAARRSAARALLELSRHTETPLLASTAAILAKSIHLEDAPLAARLGGFVTARDADGAPAGLREELRHALGAEAYATNVERGAVMTSAEIADQIRALAE